MMQQVLKNERSLNSLLSFFISSLRYPTQAWWSMTHSRLGQPGPSQLIGLFRRDIDDGREEALLNEPQQWAGKWLMFSGWAQSVQACLCTALFFITGRESEHAQVHMNVWECACMCAINSLISPWMWLKDELKADTCLCLPFSGKIHLLVLEMTKLLIRWRVFCQNVFFSNSNDDENPKNHLRIFNTKVANFNSNILLVKAATSTAVNNSRGMRRERIS